MKTLAAFALLLLVGFLGSAKLYNRLKRASPFTYLLYSGTAFIFFGYLIGPNGLNLISSAIYHHLAPLINFSLGWVGFISGFQMELKFLKRIHLHWYVILLFSYFLPFIFIFYISLLFIHYIYGIFYFDLQNAIGVSFVMAILMTESSVSFTAWSSRFFKRMTGEIRLSAFLSSVDNFFPVVLTGLIISLYSFVPSTGSIIPKMPGHALLHAIAQLAAGILCGLFTHFLIKRIQDRLEISTVLFGIVFFLSGVSLMAGFSPLFVGMTCGVVFSNLTHRHASFLKILMPTEKPIYIIFLIFLALQDLVIHPLLILLGLIILAAKFLIKKETFILWNKFNPDKPGLPPCFAHLFTPIGSISPAIILDLIYTFPNRDTSIVAGTFVVVLLISEIIAPMGIRIIQRQTGVLNR